MISVDVLMFLFQKTISVFIRGDMFNINRMALGGVHSKKG